MNTIYIMAGGPASNIPDLSAFREPTIWVGVDKGISTLRSRHIKPDIIFGDFDSVDPIDLSNVQSLGTEMNSFPAEKDDTDLALALDWALSQNPAIIRIFGNTGGRMDHTMGGIQLLLTQKALKGQTKVEIVDCQNIIFAVLAGNYKLCQEGFYPYVSFIPMTQKVTGITLDGFKYPLSNKDITLGSTLCISNELISESGTYSFDDGILLVIRSTDTSAL